MNDSTVNIGGSSSDSSRMNNAFPRLNSQRRKVSEKVKSKALHTTTRSKVARKIGNTFKEIDIYGQAINISYRGEEKYKTMPGALMSVWVIAILMAYTVYKCYILFNRINPIVDKQSLIKDLDAADPYSP